MITPEDLKIKIEESGNGVPVSRLADGMPPPITHHVHPANAHGIYSTLHATAELTQYVQKETQYISAFNKAAFGPTTDNAPAVSHNLITKPDFNV
jgi:hypothetical protein